MLNKHVLTVLALLSAGSVSANIPIELHGLSQSTNNKTDATSATSANLNWQLIQTNQQLERELRLLRGQLEEQDHEIGQLKNELNNRYVDFDQRLNLLLQKVDPDAVIETAEPTNLETQQVEEGIELPQVTSATTNSPVSTSNNVANLNAAQAPQASEQEKNAYNLVLDVFKQNGAKAAIEPMQNFIATYPKSVYVSNAYYGLAEFYLSAPADYTEAKKYFDYVVSNYPESPRVPRALMRLYSIAKDAQQNMLLAEQYKSRLVTQYPNSDDAQKFNSIN